MKTFEEYLREVHAEDYHGTDDNMPDAFDAWLAEKNGNDLIALAEKVVATQNGNIRELMKALEGTIEVLKKIKELIK